MNKIEKKINTLLYVINSNDPEKYFKSKFQDFCVDMFFSDDGEGAFILDEDYLEIRDFVDASDIIIDGINKDILVSSFSFGLFIFYGYTDFCLKSVALNKPGMKRFSEMVLNDYFYDDFPSKVFGYYSYLKRTGNLNLEKESISVSEAIFPFFEELSEFQFSFTSPKNDDGDNEEEENDSDNVKDTENSNKIGNLIKNSYSCYVNTICLSYSNFINFLNCLKLSEEFSL